MGKLLLDGWVQQQNPSPNNNNTGRKPSTEGRKKETTTTKKKPTSGLEFSRPERIKLVTLALLPVSRLLFCCRQARVAGDRTLSVSVASLSLGTPPFFMGFEKKV
jgi:hypothetical protein